MKQRSSKLQARFLASLLSLALIAGLMPAALAVEYRDGLENEGYTQGRLICDKDGKYECGLESGAGATPEEVHHHDDTCIKKEGSDDEYSCGLKEGQVIKEAVPGHDHITEGCELHVHTNYCYEWTAPAEIKVTGISLSSATLNMKVGESFPFKVTVSPENATNKNIKWTSSDDSVATVSDGTVTAKKAGETTITAAAQDGSGVTATCNVTVTDNTVAVTGVTLDKTSATVDMDKTVTLVATVAPADASNKTVTWTSSDDAVATVVNGVVTGVKAGTATITATTADGGKEDSCIVTVNSGNLSLSDTSLIPGGSTELTLGNGVTVSSCNSDNPAVTVTPDGNKIKVVVSAKATIGSIAKLTVTTSDGRTTGCTVTVAKPDVKLSATNLSVTMGKTTTLSVSGIPTGSDNSVSWTIGNNGAYATLSATTGTSVTITPKAVGSTTIRATVTVNTTTSYTLDCTLNVVAQAAQTISYSTPANTPVTFNSTDFVNACTALLKQDLSYVSFSLPSSSYGTLYYDYVSERDYSAAVSASDLYYPNSAKYISRVTFVPKSGYSGTVTINYTGYTKTDSFTGQIAITVGAGGNVNYTTRVDTAVDFDETDFQNYCRSVTGSTLDYVSFTTLPSATKGTLYYKYTSSTASGTKITTSDRYYYNYTPYLEDVTFVPASSFTGTVTIPFSGAATNGTRFTGEVTITVSANGEVTYSTAAGKAVSFSSTDFNSFCRDATGSTLDYVRFTLPASSAGTLYYNYSSSSSNNTKVTSSTNYYRNASQYLDNISFVPAANYTGTVTIPFTAYSTSGTSVRASGEVVIYVGVNPNGVTYNTGVGKAVGFVISDFNTYCKEQTGYNLERVRFTLPASTRGTLYYNYSGTSSSNTKVTASTDYYRSNSPYIDDVTFVPAANYSGTVTIPFTGYATNGSSLKGEVTIYVGDDQADITYTAASGTVVGFQLDDFNGYCKEATGYNMDYVRFTLPASSKGALYYNYASTGSTGSRVTESTNYYRSSNPYLENVSFVPASSSVGEVEILFNGRSTANTSFSGTVRITYTMVNSIANTIRYSTTGTPVNFRLNDFVSANSNRGGVAPASVTFTLPNSTQGKLYVGYASPANPGTEVKAGTSYQASSYPSVSDIVFVPKAGFTGMAIITYNGVDQNKMTYTGTIEIVVSQAAASTVFTDVGSSYSWAASSIDYLYKGNVVLGVGDGTTFAPAQQITRGDFVLMLYRAFGLRSYGTQSFPDVPTNSYYAEAIAAAKAMGISNGSDDGWFHPTDPLTRQDAMVLIQRTMNATGRTLPSASASALNGFADRGSVADYAQGAVAALVSAGVIKGNEAGNLNPGGALTRAEMATILHRVLTL